MKCPKCDTETSYIGRANCNQSNMFWCPRCKEKVFCIHIGPVVIIKNTIKKRDGQQTGKCAICGEMVSIKNNDDSVCRAMNN